MTSKYLLARATQFGSQKHFGLFHTDATFKLSDVGYSVVTCGFSDSNRRYYLAAVFVVSGAPRTNTVQSSTHSLELLSKCIGSYCMSALPWTTLKKLK